MVNTTEEMIIFWIKVGIMYAQLAMQIVTMSTATLLSGHNGHVATIRMHGPVICWVGLDMRQWSPKKTTDITFHTLASFLTACIATCRLQGCLCVAQRPRTKCKSESRAADQQRRLVADYKGTHKPPKFSLRFHMRRCLSPGAGCSSSIASSIGPFGTWTCPSKGHSRAGSKATACGCKISQS